MAGWRETRFTTSAAVCQRQVALTLISQVDKVEEGDVFTRATINRLYEDVPEQSSRVVPRLPVLSLLLSPLFMQ